MSYIDSIVIVLVILFAVAAICFGFIGFLKLLDYLYERHRVIYFLFGASIVIVYVLFFAHCIQLQYEQHGRLLWY